MSKILLKDRVEFLYGFSVRVNEETHGKYPVYGSNGITGYIDNFKVKGPGVIIGRKGTVGAINFSKEDFTPTDTAYYLSLKDSKQDDIKFWYYYLKLLGLNKLNTHSSVPGLSREIAYFLNINPPKFIAQQKIAAVLSALDAKIELNTRINAELEALAKTLYDYWFVQFDFPFDFAQGRPDADGKPYKSSGGAMVWNAALKREIPAGWESILIGEVLTQESKTKKIPTSEILAKGLIPVIDQSTDYIAGFTDDEEAVIKANEPRIIFGDHTRILKLINFDFARGADGTQVLLSNTKRMPQHLFYHTLLKIDLSNYGYARHFKFLKETKIIVPDEIIAQKFEETVKKNYDMIRHNIFENQTLAALRDWLLPLLMNGQAAVG